MSDIQTIDIALVLNGKPERASIEPRELLIHTLREKLAAASADALRHGAERAEITATFEIGPDAAIRRWRLKQALGRTWERRPDLLRGRTLSAEEQALLAEYRQERQAVQQQ